MQIVKNGKAGQDYRELMASRINKINLSPVNAEFAPLIQSSMMAYEKYNKQPMRPMVRTVLTNSIDNLISSMVRQMKTSREMIKSAAVDHIWDVENPINMLFNLLSIVVPNFAFMEVAGVQPMPTKTAPLLFPQLTANTDRNGFKPGDRLLGYDGWAKSNLYTSNRNKVNATLTVDSKAVAVDTTMEGKEVAIELDKVKITWIPASGVGGQVLTVASDGTVTPPASETAAVTGTVAADTGAFNLTLANNAAAGDILEIDYRYDLDQWDPAQVVFEWVSRQIDSHPYRIRSVYRLDDFYGAKKTLAGVEFDLDKALATTMAGYVNKEISGSIFDNIADQVTDITLWDKTPPVGVSWAFNRLSVLEPLIAMKNQIRKDTARAAGNVIIAGNDLMNNIESLGNDMWAPVGYDAEPIGPYVAGKLNGIFKIIKNQEYPDNKSVMTFKNSDTDAAYMVGVFLGLYATEPLSLDTLKVVQGMGSMLGELPIFPKAFKELDVIASNPAAGTTEYPVHTAAAA
jgi:CYTH domain-containing protein